MISRMCLSLGLKTLSASCGNNQILKGTTIFQGRQRDQVMCTCRGMSYCISPSAKENWIVHLPSFLHLYLLFSGGSGVPLALLLQLQLLLMKNQRTHCCAYFQTFNQLKVTFRSDLVHIVGLFSWGGVNIAMFFIFFWFAPIYHPSPIVLNRHIMTPCPQACVLSDFQFFSTTAVW